jgi:hypothetical protein
MYGKSYGRYFCKSHFPRNYPFKNSNMAGEEHPPGEVFEQPKKTYNFKRKKQSGMSLKDAQNGVSLVGDVYQRTERKRSLQGQKKRFKSAAERISQKRKQNFVLSGKHTNSH